ncbi:response regulator transcription factor [Streptosporangium lutulentum]|uniref:DNA-binding NarL/FixJ family response regulator n=1 Tax=Streptosporangium lutulentum TaxID=1461250 RepID=A0ABT9QCZ2_9ACTN|nr:hypothetical protein [Streptosporangium lutulentum]MDP9844632.1 DNA-binding NarL/FixJ family response regulator [Streptosporangium lutulentum]
MADTGPEALTVALRARPDIVPLDVETPGGDGITDVAGRLHLSEGAVRDDLSPAVRKTRARDRVEAVRRARSPGRL